VHLFFGFRERECTDMFAAAKTGVSKVWVLGQKKVILHLMIVIVHYLPFVFIVLT
jgi:hypothetical protein